MAGLAFFLAPGFVKGTEMRTQNEPQLYDLSTKQFGDLNQVKPQSVSARVCRTGSYFGVVPKKLANGRLAWPNVQPTKGAI